MIEQSKDYHDYVFRDGKLVGEFEAMYRHSEVVPWNQDKQDNWIDVRLTVDMLKDLGPFNEIHDLACGLGHYLALIQKHLGAEDCRPFGYDISETACVKAQSAFPEFSFQPLDLTHIPDNSSGDRSPHPSRLFMIRATLWYVVPKLANVVKTIRSLMSAGDKLLVVQNFPPLDGPFIGKNVIPNHAALIQHFAESFLPERYLWYEDTLKRANDNWFIGLFSLRDT